MGGENEETILSQILVTLLAEAGGVGGQNDYSEP